MKRIVLALAATLVISCATAPPPRSPSSPRSDEEPARLSNRLTPLPSLPRAIAEPRIRVGLLSDQSSVTFPRTEGGYYVIGDAGPALIRRGFTVTAPLPGVTARYAVQAATIWPLTSAEESAARLRTETGQRVDLAFDPAAGQYRILAGDFATVEEGRGLRDELSRRGAGGRELPIVRRPAAQAFERRHELADDEGDRYTVPGESILVMPAVADTIMIGDKPYRTSARLFINARGLVNLINELNLEEYLYGVVPAEMGPRIYDEIEALKAQAVAARTYAVRNFRQFASEGFDICPGPQCQAYKGFSGEETLSTQAVRDTAGLIATHDGKPIDALYTSTCGGETSDVSTMFPGRNEPYLRRARCVEMEMVTLAGRADSGLLSEAQVAGRTFASIAQLPEGGESWSARDVESAVAAAQRLIGAEKPAPGALGSSRRGEVLRYLSRVMRLEEKARVLTLPEDRKYFFAQTNDPDDPAHLAAAFLIKYGLVPTQHIDRIDFNAAMPREELYALLGSWLREHDAIGELTGKIAAVEGRTLALKADGRITRIVLPPGVPVFRRLGDRFQEYKNLPIMIGDRAFVLQGAKKVPVAVTVQANFDGAAFDRTSSFANWTRSYRADDLVTSINRRNPIKELVDLKPITIDASQRIAELEVTAEGGRKFMLRGLPVRWSLNVPDNLFAYEKTRDADGVERYTFFGKGWGHGTGMCQVGAYGMAFRGYKFDQILKRYYSGIEIQPFTR